MHVIMDARQVHVAAEAWKRAPEMVIEELSAAMFEAEMLLERESKELTPVGVGAAGGLRGNIQSTMPEVLSDTVLGMVGSTLSYAEAVEIGTKAHPVSYAGVASIADWVRHKLGISDDEAERVAHAISWKIQHYGTPAVGMFHRALAYNKQQLAGIFQMATANIARRLGEV